MYAYTEIEYRENQMNNFIEDEMCKIKINTSKILDQYFAQHSHTKTTDEIVDSYFGDDQSVIDIADFLNLGKIEILSLSENFDEFKEVYINEMKMYGDCDYE